MRERHEILETERRHRAERASRIGRVKRWLRRLPRQSNVARYPVVRWFAAAAKQRPYLWSFKGPPVRRAIYVGAVIAFLPVYGLQLFLAFWAAVATRANLTVVCAFQLATNPLTAGPVYYATYRLGTWIIATLDVGEGFGPMGTRVNALVLGGLVVGLAAGLAADLLARFVVWEAGQLRARHAASRTAADALRRREVDSPPVAAPGHDEG